MFNENQFSKFTEYLVFIAIFFVMIDVMKNSPINPYGYILMLAGGISLIWSKVPNLKEKKWISFGVDNIKPGYKTYYSCGYILMILGFLVTFKEIALF